MMEREDPILDACLDEVLGNRQPPDLTARILQALSERRAVAGEFDKAAAPVPSDRLLPAFSVQPSPVAQSNVAQSNGQVVSPAARRRQGNPSKSRPRWNSLLVAACVGGLGIALGIAALQFSRWRNADDRLANNQPTKSGGSADQGGGVGTQPGHLATTGKTNRRVPDRLANDGDRGPKIIPLEVPGPAATNADDAQPPPQPSRYAHQPIPEEELLSFVNAEIQRSWTEANIVPASVARDSEWCRRVYLRLLGRIPSNEEVSTFVDDKSATKRQQLVDRLLGDEYADQFARHWASVWSNVLIGRTGGAEGSLASREGLVAYLERALLENKPYRQIVSELLTATGANRVDAPDFNGAVNFLLAGLGDDASVATARVSRVFLGQQLHCAQCHTHPSDETWSQEQFWALNSFLRQAQAKREGSIVRLSSGDFASKEGEVYYQLPNGELKATWPRFIDGTTIPPSGKLAEVDRRQELARLVADSPELPRALVNRLWSHFFGYGFTQPIDDMGPHNAPSHPQVLDALAGQFAAYDYDLKRAIRWIVLSDPFSRSSQIPAGGLADMPDSGKAPLFSRYYTRPLKAEEVYNSLLAAADIRQRADNTSELSHLRRDFLEQFYRKIGTDDGEEESHEGGTRQIELMINSSLTRRAVSAEHNANLNALTKSDMPLGEKIEHLFLTALSRKPTAQEQQAIAKIVANAHDQQAAVLEDIWWALLNSNEFVLDH